jgi:hypothetical protein
MLVLGCGESENITNPDPANLPASTTELMNEFTTALAEMDYDHYDQLLDGRFTFEFNNTSSRDKVEDLISTDNMLSGEARINNDGIPTRAISDIAVDQMLIREAWESVSPSHPLYGSIPGVKQSLYQVRIVFYHSGGTITLETFQTFYAVPMTTDGETTWSLIGQRDEAKKSNESMAWGGIKNLFR